jgi:dTDP-4-amino-4,6-dideoxygalactose transaminase
MFSFGPIKTATALGGGLLRVRDRDLLARMREAQAAWPTQSGRSFVARLAKYALLKFLSGRLAFRLLMSALRLLGRDVDRTLNGAVRNFPGEELIAQLRQQMPTAMLRLLARRLRTFHSTARLERRARHGRRLAARLAASFECPGAAAAQHSFWVFPLCVADPVPVLAALRAAGFDASAGSQLRPVAGPDGTFKTTPNAVRITATALFLPLYPELPDSEVGRLAEQLEITRARERPSHTDGEGDASATGFDQPPGQEASVKQRSPTRTTSSPTAL